MNEQPTILLSDNTAAALLGIGRATFWRQVSDKTLPAPIEPSGAIRWRRDELLAAIEKAAALLGNAAEQRDILYLPEESTERFI